MPASAACGSVSKALDLQAQHAQPLAPAPAATRPGRPPAARGGPTSTTRGSTRHGLPVRATLHARREPEGAAHARQCCPRPPRRSIRWARGGESAPGPGRCRRSGAWWWYRPARRRSKRMRQHVRRRCRHRCRCTWKRSTTVVAVAAGHRCDRAGGPSRAERELHRVGQQVDRAPATAASDRRAADRRRVARVQHQLQPLGPRRCHFDHRRPRLPDQFVEPRTRCPPAASCPASMLARGRGCR